jgi:[calcium/calmodulin-dependent protein kinase] kinase
MIANRRIQVDNRDLERAVIPITLLERARSAVKTAIGTVMGVKALAREL